LHLTWVFLGDVKDDEPIIDKLKAYREKTLGLILSEIHLYESTLTSKGAEYVCRHTIKI